METETLTVRPFPAAPDFAATELQRRAFAADMREAWLDRAELWTTQADNAARAGNHLDAEVLIADVRMALTQARIYRPTP